MKLFCLLLSVCCLKFAVSESERGSTSLQARSDTAKGKIFVSYQRCLNFVPTFVDATVVPHDAHLPHKFNATVIEILSSGFWLEIKRSDKDFGWHAHLLVNWMICFDFGDCGNGIMYEGRFIWMPEPKKITQQNLSQSAESCRKVGGKLVDIMDGEMFDVVYDYARKNFNDGGDYVDIWLAMIYNTTNEKLTSSGGLPAYPHTTAKWLPDTNPYPRNQRGRTAIAMQVRSQQDTTNIGFWNGFSDYQDPQTTDLCTKFV